MNKTKKILFYDKLFTIFYDYFSRNESFCQRKVDCKNIEKADEATVKMIDAHLRKQQALKLNINGNKKVAEKKMETLRKKIKK